jgi:hypothetical protein
MHTAIEDARRKLGQKIIGAVGCLGDRGCAGISLGSEWAVAPEPPRGDDAQRD